MYILHVNPITSAKWDGKDLVKDIATDNMHLKAGGRSKNEEAGREEGLLQKENADRASETRASETKQEA